MPRNITVTFQDGSTHVYRNAPDNVTPDQVAARAQQDFGKQVKALDGGRGANRQAQPRPANRPAQPSMMQQMGRAFSNTAAGLMQGFSAPMDAIFDAKNGYDRVVNSLGGSIAAGALNAFGNPQAAARARKMTAAQDRAIYRQRLNTSDVVERMVPTPQDTAGKVARIGAQFVGGSIVPIPTAKAPTRIPTSRPPATSAQQLVREGERAGVRVLTSDIRPPRTFMGKAAQKLGESIPVAGTGGVRAAQQTERVQAVKTLLAEHGIDDTASPVIDSVATDLAATRGASVSKFKGAKDAIIDGVQGRVPVTQTLAAIDAQIAKLKGLKSAEYAPVIAKLNDWRQAVQGQNLRNIEDIRALMGTAFDDPGLAGIKSTGQKAVNAIYGPLRADMGAFIEAQAGRAARVKWQGANDRLSAMAGELKVGAFRRALSDAETTPENVSRLLFSNKPSDVRRLYSNLSAKGRAKAQAAVLQRAMEKAIPAGKGLDEISPDNFVNAVDRLGSSVGVVFQGGDLVRIEGLSRVIKATQRASQAGVMTPTGQQVVPYAIGAVGITNPVKTITAGVAARIYESASVRNLLLKLGRTAPGSAQEGAILSQVMRAIEAETGRLGVAATSQANRVLPMLEGNIAAPLAAEGQQQEQQ